MKLVHFPKELHLRAPQLLSIFYEDPSAKPVQLQDLLEAIARQDLVIVRPASEREMRRAEAYVALYEIGMKLAEKVSVLLDQDDPVVATGKFSQIQDAIESIDMPFEILDHENNGG